MIDFRYHIVSLISVFLALAVGIVLGAGPLREPIGESLTSQVESLRQDRDQLRAEAANAEAVTNGQNAFITDTAPELLSDTLRDRPVVVLALPGANEDALKGVEQRLGDAGATLTTRATLSEDILAPANAQDILDDLAAADPELPNAPVEKMLQAVSTALVSKPDQSDEDAEKGQQLLEVLTAAGVLTLSNESPPTAELAIVVDQEYEIDLAQVGATAEPSDGATPADDEGSDERFLQLLTDLQSGSEGAVLAGTTTAADQGLLAKARSGQADYSITDGVLTPAGQVIAVMALGAQTRQQSGSYGFTDGVDSVLPPRN